jgi:diaminopimelate decarboxylase
MANGNKYHLTYKNNELHFDGISITKAVKEHQTPFYLYNKSILTRQFLEFQQSATKYFSNTTICFALKANNNIELLKSLAALGSGADIVSGGELKQALKAKIPAKKIVFSGVGKTSSEIEFALKKKIYSFNVESLEELELINNLAKKINTKASIAFRLNPKVQAKTHKHISTGYKTHKFGLLESDILKAIKNKKYWSHTKLIGLSVHIGSQLTDLKATLKATHNMCNLGNKIPQLEFLDVGGGLAVDYHPEQEVPSIEMYMQEIAKVIQAKNLHKNIKILFEPGRRIVARAGVFVTSVLRTKQSEDCHFLIVDGGMNDFVRPSLYEAYHHIFASKKPNAKSVLYDIVGPICETADCFASARKLPKLSQNDFIVICDTGAYGKTMSSTYNMRSHCHEILI